MNRILAATATLAFACAAAPGFAAAPAAPTAWVADPAKSTLEFQFVQAGAKTSGRFARFTTNVDLDPAKLAAARIDVAIDIASVDTKDKDRDTTLKTPELFDPAKFPRATYVATQVTAKGAGFEGRGKLSLRGVAADVPIAFTFTPGTEAGAPVATMKGTAALKRLTFGVGQGEWKSTEWISDDVQVSFNLRLVPRASAPQVPATPAPATKR
jgi:polyisoprenoid-binding protein YceI